MAKEKVNHGVIVNDGTGITSFPADVKDAEADEVVENYSPVYDEPKPSPKGKAKKTTADTAGSRAGNPDTKETH